MKIAGLSKKEIEQVQLLINIRPRKAIGYLNPLEFLTGQRVSLIVGF
jgi:IS30 family transposase